jgi:hypothetical protein
MSSAPPSPERALVVLRRELAHDRAALLRHCQEAESLLAQWPSASTDPGSRARAALALHAWYTGIEALLERLVREVDGEAMDGSSPRDVIYLATGEVPGVRPEVLPAAFIDDLLDLMGFRDFLRSAYRSRLDADQLGAHLGRLVRIAAQVDAWLTRFDTFLGHSRPMLARF